MNYYLYLCPQTREIYHGKIKSDKNRSSRTRPKQQVVGLEALIAIANALEVPVQELVRQEEFNQEK